MKFKCAGFISSTLAVLAFSCSIIQDSDIKSAAEASNLKLTLIKIDQAVQTSGNFSTVATPLVDKVVSISTTAGLVNRYVEFGAPVFPTNGKIKYKTAVADGSKLYVYYFSTGKPSSLGIYKENVVSGKVKDSTFYEVYRFRYDASGRLTKFTTFLNPTAAPTTNDTLIYGLGNQVATILRRGPNPQQIVTVQYQGDMIVSNIKVAQATSQSPTIMQINGGNNCFTCASASASSLNYDQSGQNSNTGSGGNSSPLLITYNALTTKPQTLTFENVLNLGYGPDTYYFHPFMILSGQVPDGSALLHIYMIDWWKLGTGGQSTGNNNFVDKVKFTFNYVKQ